MTPEQITAQIDEIISSIADAHILIYRLKNALEVAAKADQAVDVVYSDIWMDAGLGATHKSLRIMERQLAVWLPEHFKRLRTGVV